MCHKNNNNHKKIKKNKFHFSFQKKYHNIVHLFCVFIQTDKRGEKNNSIFDI